MIYVNRILALVHSFYYLAKTNIILACERDLIILSPLGIVNQVLDSDDFFAFNGGKSRGFGVPLPATQATAGTAVHLT